MTVRAIWPCMEFLVLSSVVIKGFASADLLAGGISTVRPNALVTTKTPRNRAIENEFCAELLSEDCPSKRPYRCPSNGKCIGKKKLCNQQIQCPNAEDEIVCCDVEQASYSEQCRNFAGSQRSALCSIITQCISEEDICDGKVDCSDFTDEIMCLPENITEINVTSHQINITMETVEPVRIHRKSFLHAILKDQKNPLPKENQVCVRLFSEDCQKKSPDSPYRCPSNGECIARDKLCDQSIQCPEAEDETVCCEDVEQASFSVGCVELTKGELSTQCSIITQCISEDAICNGKTDCRDFTDEIQCHGNEIRPENGFCEQLFSEDCFYQSRDTPYRCPSNGKCISRDKLCDQSIHCSEAEDEIVCCNIGQASHSEKCLLFTEGLYSILCSVITQCILSEENICDGKVDCVDFTDEIQCSESLKAPSKKEFCKILFSEDCPDESPYRCPSSEECIAKDQLCDQSIKCPEAEDELLCCDVKQASYSEGCRKFVGSQLSTQCSIITQCISEEAICDGKVDCKDFTDEFKCSRAFNYDKVS